MTLHNWPPGYVQQSYFSALKWYSDVILPSADSMIVTLIMWWRSYTLQSHLAANMEDKSERLRNQAPGPFWTGASKFLSWQWISERIGSWTKQTDKPKRDRKQQEKAELRKSSSSSSRCDPGAALCCLSRAGVSPGHTAWLHQARPCSLFAQLIIWTQRWSLMFIFAGVLEVGGGE